MNTEKMPYGRFRRDDGYVLVGLDEKGNETDGVPHILMRAKGYKTEAKRWEEKRWRAAADFFTFLCKVDPDTKMFKEDDESKNRFSFFISKAKLLTQVSVTIEEFAKNGLGNPFLTSGPITEYSEESMRTGCKNLYNHKDRDGVRVVGGICLGDDPIIVGQHHYAMFGNKDLTRIAMANKLSFPHNPEAVGIATEAAIQSDFYDVITFWRIFGNIKYTESERIKAFVAVFKERYKEDIFLRLADTIVLLTNTSSDFDALIATKIILAIELNRALELVREIEGRRDGRKRFNPKFIEELRHEILRHSR